MGCEDKRLSVDSVQNDRVFLWYTSRKLSQPNAGMNRSLFKTDEGVRKFVFSTPHDHST